MFNLMTIAACSMFLLAAVGASAEARAEDAGKPFLKKTDLFDGMTRGVFVYRIPGIVVTAKGTILAYCEARYNNAGDYTEIESHLRRSTDGGKSWEKPRKIAHMGPRIESNPAGREGVRAKEQLAGNPCAIADRDGNVHFLYQVNYERAFYMRSSDDGVTFSDPVEITPTFDTYKSKYPWTVIAIGPTHGIQLKGGRLVVPFWLAYGERGKHAPSVAGTIYSDDGGETWKPGDIALPNEGELKDPNESILVELADGTVMLNGRSPSPASRRLVTLSNDGATGWSKPRFEDALWDPVCAAGITKLNGEPETLIFSNPWNLARDDEGNPVNGGRGLRRNLSIQLSPDSGKTWTARRTLEEGMSAYSDLTELPDGSIACFYERDQRLTFARFNKAWILEGNADE